VRAAPPQPPNDDAPQARSDIPAAEWVVAALGALLLLGAIAYLGLEAARGPGRPPDVVLAVDTVTPGRGGWHVRVRASNRGDETAADVGVRGTLTAPHAAPLVREATVDYLPGRSERRVGLVFPTDPRAGTLRLEVLGHREP
jgi:uncharacterized protein (TIGR02588 family)